MTPIVWVNILWAGFVLLLILIVLILFWRKKQQRHIEFERLLEDVKDRQESRSASLSRRMVEKFKMDALAAQALSEDLITAEKRFLQQFIEQQLQQKSVENIYAQLCDLLDSYLLAMPNQGDVAEKLPEQSVDQNGLADESSDSESAEDEAILPDDAWGNIDD
jgi:arginine deiminase